MRVIASLSPLFLFLSLRAIRTAYLHQVAVMLQDSSHTRQNSSRFDEKPLYNLFHWGIKE